MALESARPQVQGQMEVTHVKHFHVKVCLITAEMEELFCFPHAPFWFVEEVPDSTVGLDGVKLLLAWLLLVNWLETYSASLKRQRGAIAAAGAWPLGMVPVPGAREINAPLRANFSHASGGREKKKRAVQKRACSFVCSRDASCLELWVRWGWLLAEGFQFIAVLLLACKDLNHWKACC